MSSPQLVFETPNELYTISFGGKVHPFSITVRDKQKMTDKFIYLTAYENLCEFIEKWLSSLPEKTHIQLNKLDYETPLDKFTLEGRIDGFCHDVAKLL